ncbi:MAG TPA: response regulator transcription factor [Pseudonocardiaceae bacterium]
MNSTMVDRVPVLLQGGDAISQAGLAATLRAQQDIRLVEPAEAHPECVVMFTVDRIDAETRQKLRALQCRGFKRIVLISSHVDDGDLMAVVEDGVSAVTRRSETTPELLVRLAKAAARGDGVVPADLLGRLLDRVSRLQRNVLEPKGLNLAGMSERETAVLRLVADGFDTREIAERLCYSQRTVKTILYDITNRFQLRNRSHAVAYALREGLI